MADEMTYYELLEIERNATEKQVVNFCAAMKILCIKNSNEFSQI